MMSSTANVVWNWVSPVSWWRWWNGAPGGQFAGERNLSFSTLRRARECGICLEELRYPRLMDCLHAFCTDCLRKHLSASRRADGKQCPALISCPTCREETIVHYGDALTSMRHDVTFAMAELVFRASVQASLAEGAGQSGQHVRVSVPDELRTLLERGEDGARRAASEVFAFLDNAVDLHEEMRARAHDLVSRGERDREAIMETLHREFSSSVDKMIIRDKDVFERYSDAQAGRLLVDLIARFYETRLQGDAADSSPSASRCFAEFENFDAEHVSAKAVYAAARYLLDFDNMHHLAQTDSPLDDEAVRCIGELRNLRGRIINESLRRDAYYANAFLFRPQDSSSSAEASEDAMSFTTVNKAGLPQAGLRCTVLWRVGQRAPQSTEKASSAPLGSFEWCTHANFLDYCRSNSERAVVCDKMNSRLQLVDLDSGVCSVSLLDGLVRPRRVAQLPDERVAICDEFGETLKLFDLRAAGGAPTELGHTRSVGQPQVHETTGWQWPTGEVENEWKNQVVQSVQRVSDGTFRCCAGLAVTSDGHLACADPDRGFVCTIEPNSGSISTKFTTRFLDDRYVPHPYFVAVDTSDSISTVFADAKSDEDGQLLNIEPSNDVLITSDTTNNIVKVYSRHGRVLNSIGGFRCARGLCADNRGRLFVADADNHRIALHDASGKYLADVLDASDGVCYPMSVALNRNSSLLLLAQCGVYSRHKVTLARLDQLDNRVDALLEQQDELVSRNPLLINRQKQPVDVTEVQVA